MGLNILKSNTLFEYNQTNIMIKGNYVMLDI